MKEKMLELFQDYGTLETIKKIKEPGKPKTMVYGYAFKMSTIMEDVEDLTANFLLVDQGELITLVKFGLNDALNENEEVLNQLNRANTEMLYGKFLVDGDNDVYWECSFESSKVSREDVLAIIRAFINGLSILLKWKEKLLDE